MRKTESISLHHRHHPLTAPEPPPRSVRGAKHHRGTPEDPHPGLGDGSPRLPALPWGCIPRGVPGLCLPAARCRCPLLPALPPAAARGSRRGVGGAELPQFGKGRSGGPSKSGPGGVTQAQPPALRCLEGGCFCSFVSAPPDLGLGCCGVLEGRGSPEAAPQHGWVWVGGLVWHPPAAHHRPSPSLCGLEGVMDSHCHGNVAFCMPARSLPWQCGIVLLGKEGGMDVGRRAWAWLCWRREEIPLPQKLRSHSAHQGSLHQFTQEPRAHLCLGGGSRTSGDSTVMPQATSLLF